MPRFSLVDVCTETPFSGAQVPITVDERELPADWMQALTLELTLSDAVFVTTGQPVSMRTFTADGEVDYSVRGAIATAHVLREQHAIGGDRLEVSTRTKTFTVHSADGLHRTDLDAVVPEPTEIPPEIAAMLESVAVWAGRTDKDILIEVSSEAELQAIRLEYDALRGLPARGVIVTAPGTGRFDVVSRFFAWPFPDCEDVVTASAHAALGPYWSAKLGKSRLVARQASRRGGVLELDVAGETVTVGARAVTVVDGNVLLGDS